MPAGLIALSNRPSRFGKNLNLRLPREIDEVTSEADFSRASLAPLRFNHYHPLCWPLIL